MSIVINYKKNTPKIKFGNFIFFVDEKYNLSGLKKYFNRTENDFIRDVLKSQNLSKNIISFDLSSKKKIFLISIKNNLNFFQVENLGADFFNFLKDIKQYEILINTDFLSTKLNNFVGYFLHGFKLKSYTFEKYKLRKIKNILINVIEKNIPSAKDQIKFKAIEQGTLY